MVGLDGCDAPTTMLEAGVLATEGHEGGKNKREYVVQTEFQPDGVGLDDESFDEYLSTFERARVTQESMTSKIRDDLREALGLDDLFVEVHRMAPSDKRTILGSPK